MSSLLTEIVIESTDPVHAATFWSAALGWEIREYMPGNVPWMSASGDPDQHDLKLVFVRAHDSRSGAFDSTSTPADVTSPTRFNVCATWVPAWRTRATPARKRETIRGYR